MSFKSTSDPEIKVHVESGVFYYRGTPKKGDPNIMRSLGVKSFAEAQKKKRVLLEDLRGFDLSSKKVLFGDYVKNVFLKERKRKSMKTYEQAVYSCNYLLAFFERHYVHTINDSSWHAYVDWCQATKPRWLWYDRRTMIMIFTRLHTNGVGNVRHIPKCEIPDFTHRKRRTLKHDEIVKLAHAFRIHLNPSYHKYEGIVLMMYKMGFRTEDAVELLWRDVHFDKNLVRVVDTKSNKGVKQSRDVVMDPEVRNWLHTWKKKTGGVGPVFPSKSRPGTPIKAIHKKWNKVCEEVGLKKPYDPYCLRHTFLTEAGKRVAGGTLNIAKVCRYAGTSIDMFEKTYLHLDGAETADVAGIITEPILGNDTVVKNL